MEEYSKWSFEEKRETLEYLYDKYCREEFIESDPISVPHLFSRTEDREIAGLLASTIAWGNRKAIVKSAHRMMQYMDFAPYDFVLNAGKDDLKGLETFVHRTFSGKDFRDTVGCIGSVCRKWGSLGEMFQTLYQQTGSVPEMLSEVRKEFFSFPHDPHCEKHMSSIDRGAACKRLNMYLRWMVRKDSRGVDFGLWERIPVAELRLPLDVHTTNMGHAFGLLKRRQSDWKATEEITRSLRSFDPSDPVRFDFALFGAGIDGFLKR